MVWRFLLACPAQGGEGGRERRVLKLCGGSCFPAGPSGKSNAASCGLGPRAPASACLWLGLFEVMLSLCYSFSCGLAEGHMILVFGFWVHVQLALARSELYKALTFSGVSSGLLGGNLGQTVFWCCPDPEFVQLIMSWWVATLARSCTPNCLLAT